VLPAEGTKISICIALVELLATATNKFNNFQNPAFFRKRANVWLTIIGLITVLTAGRIGIFLLQFKHIERKINRGGYNTVLDRTGQKWQHRTFYEIRFFFFLE
jgi:hypothetical protein